MINEDKEFHIAWTLDRRGQVMQKMLTLMGLKDDASIKLAHMASLEACGFSDLFKDDRHVRAFNKCEFNKNSENNSHALGVAFMIFEQALKAIILLERGEWGKTVAIDPSIVEELTFIGRFVKLFEKQYGRKMTEGEKLIHTGLFPLFQYAKDFY